MISIYSNAITNSDNTKTIWSLRIYYNNKKLIYHTIKIKIGETSYFDGNIIPICAAFKWLSNNYIHSKDRIYIFTKISDITNFINFEKNNKTLDIDCHKIKDLEKYIIDFKKKKHNYVGASTLPKLGVNLTSKSVILYYKCVNDCNINVSKF